MDELISRQAAIDAVEESRRLNHHQDGKVACNHEYEHRHFLKILGDLPPAQPEGWVKIPDTGIDDLSDGFHTFRQLYYQRMMLFATIVRQNREKAWKSLRHEDGKFCFGGEWFIVGIDTPEGSYTYHYENKYFDLFDCEILDYGKHWDGHTEKDVTRLLSLPSAQTEPEEFEWCTDCKEYDQEAHCCHRWTKVIRNTVEEIKGAQPEPRWIPVTEKPPKERRSYWVCTDTGYQCECRWTNNIYGLWNGLWESDQWGWSIFDIPQYSKVIAYMPLPKPYERSEE